MSGEVREARRRLIVNADDYGISRKVSEGLLRAHEHGIVTSTTTLVTTEDAARALREARDRCPSLGVGLHLCLTDLKPLSPPSEIPTLVGANGQFPSRHELNPRVAAINPDEVRLELKRQVDKFTSIAGCPTHLDSHQFVTNWYPPFVAIMCSLANDLGSIPVRWFPTAAAVLASRSVLTSSDAQAHQGACARLQRELRVRCPDHFIREFFGDAATEQTLLRLLQGLNPGVTELMCHPGDLDLDLEDGYVVQRPVELQILSSPAVKDALRALEIDLVHFGALAHATPAPG